MPFAVPLPSDLTAGRWHLRALSDDDWTLEQAMSRDPDVVRGTLYPPDLSEESARQRVGRTKQRAGERVAGRYAVLDGHVAVGTAGIAFTDAGDAEVFYALLPHGRHQGAATQAACALSEWALSAGAKRVLLVTIPGNSASEAVARRAGFTVDGQEVRDQRGNRIRMTRWSRSPPSESGNT
jgi:RimJ/RimL family protein N-acetyltransferase